MPLNIVVGGFFGDEGKGKIASYLALVDRPSIAVRTGSVNAGHTVIYNGRVYRLRLIPSFFVNPSTKLFIAAGALIRLDILFREVEETGSRGRIFIDFNAGVIEDRHIEMERSDPFLSKDVGSTLQGVGYAMADRVLRRLRLAKDFDVLRDMLIDVVEEVNKAVDMGETVYIEGVQGTFLSLYHGTYPYVTSRDTTASAFLSEVGIGPKKVDHVIVVFKSYVTRVGGGPLENELSFEEAEKLGLVEVATVTGRRRRVAQFNFNLARRAVILNSATQIAITRLDALFPGDRCVREWDKLSIDARKWLLDVEDRLRVPITIISTGEDVMCTVDRRRDYGVV
ncbi:Adenylosuccinate synthetase [Ignisphaera aggregans DSM 17230]|uniref:Adenylosuccinate synthetase n=1 Tax=Ignisphaera aggregans (strain DSM 17230 / JCM 13409 / AQ1.S1) TaxID=583356 RepID=E0SRV7_IGNAA|nr:Adenylosuccinate synthetase [Ignisphaera aggregans DSM 17230]